MFCEETDFTYPLLADIYYPLIGQGQYGNIKKQWVFDRTVACNAEAMTRSSLEEVGAKVFLQDGSKLTARTKSDIRISERMQEYGVTSILITNIRDKHENLVYKETSGSRSGKGTIYEVATFEPALGAFGDVERYRMLWRRTENQSIGD